MLYTLASLDEKELTSVQELERKIGKRVIAMRPMTIEFDQLSEEDVAAIQQLEVELGIVIMAVK